MFKIANTIELINQTPKRQSADPILPYPPEVRENPHAMEFWQHATECLAELGLLERADIGLLTD